MPVKKSRQSTSSRKTVIATGRIARAGSKRSVRGSAPKARKANRRSSIARRSGR